MIFRIQAAATQNNSSCDPASVFRDGFYRDVMLLPQPSGKNDVDDDVSNIMQFQYSFGRCKIFLGLIDVA